MLKLTIELTRPLQSPLSQGDFDETPEPFSPLPLARELTSRSLQAELADEPADDSDVPE